MRVRRLLAGLVLLATPLVAAPAVAQVAEADLPARAADTERLAGDDRFATAAEVALAYADGVDTVLLARGDSFPDALAGAFLAGDLDAPVLLTLPDALPAVTAQAIADLGASEVVLLGGPSAISDDVALGLLADGLTVRRLGGENRFDTAAVIATAGSGAVGQAPNVDGDLRRTVLLATGGNFPDALAAGPLAAINSHPVLLTLPDALPAETIAALDSLDAEQVLVLGGTAAVGDAVVDALEDLGLEVQRVSGADRFATAGAIAGLTRTVLELDGEDVLVTTGRNFPDALALASLADTRSATLVLADTDALTTPAFEHLDHACGATTLVTAAGGTTALSDDVLGQAALATSCADGVFPLDAQFEVGSEGDADGRGLARLYVDPTDTSTLCLQLQVSDVAPATAAHIHSGVFDRDGPVVAALPTPDGGGFAAGCLTEVAEGTVAELRDAIVAVPNTFYVNVHNAEHPAGVLRANMVHDQDRRLDGAWEVSDAGAFEQGDLDASGTFHYTLLDDRVCWFLDVADVTGGVVAAHVHEGRVDANGDVVLALDPGLAREALTRGGCVDATSDQLDALGTGADGYYVNVHSADVPAGALRSQMGPTLVALANGFAENDGVGGFQTGDLGAFAEVDHFTGSDDAGTTVLCTEVVTLGDPADDTFVAGHVHTGTADENGAVLIDLEMAGEDVDVAWSCVDADTTDVAAVAADAVGHYVNLHTTTFPAGAYRGQLAATTATLLTGAQEVTPTGDDDRSSVDDPVGQAAFAGFANDAGDTLCWTLVVTSLSSNDADLPDPSGFHVHAGATGANGPVALNLLDPGAAGFGVFDADLGIGQGCISDDAGTEVGDVLGDLDGHYVNLHTDLDSDAFVNGAVRGQLG